MSDTASAIMLLAFAPACALLLLAIPRPVTPAKLPALRFDARQADEVLRSDRLAARAAPRTAAAIELENLLLQQGDAERNYVETFSEFQMRRDRFKQAMKKFRQEGGEKALIALRARGVTQFEAVLDLALDKRLSQRILGSFPNFLQRYRATIDGEFVRRRLSCGLCIKRVGTSFTS